nr:DUF551 domain-containing protein [Klebsiella pneumoniae]
MTNNQLAENSAIQLLNSVKLARDNAERADNRVDHSFYYALTIALEELQERRKADSEPVELPRDYLQGHKDGLEWASQLAEANHPETGDWLYDDPIELAKAIRKGPDMPPAQPVADSEPVAWTWHYREQWHVTNDERRAEFVAKDGDVAVLPLYRHAQQPVVDADDNFYSWFGREWQDNYQHNQYTTAAKQMLGMMAESAWKAATERQRQKQSVSVPDVKIYEDVPYEVGRFKTHRDCYCDGWNACRAAMLQSGNSPVVPDERAAFNAWNNDVDCPLAGRDAKSAAWLAWQSRAAMLAAAPQSPGSEPATVPGKWIPVSERMPEAEGHYLVWANASRIDGYCDHLAIATYQGGEWSNEFNWLVTHWMPLPAAPREVINALITLVSRNEREVK